MLTVSDFFNITVLGPEAPPSPTDFPNWDRQPAPAFKAKTIGEVQLEASTESGGVLTFTWAPTSAPVPSWLTIIGSKLRADASQTGQTLNGLRLRVTNEHGNFTDSNAFSIIVIGWTTVPDIQFIEGTADTVDLTNYYVGFDGSAFEIQLADGSLDGVSLVNNILTYDGLGVAATDTYVFDVVSIVGGGNSIIGSIVPLSEDKNSDPTVGSNHRMWGVWREDYNRRLKLRWQRGQKQYTNHIGDWLDKNGVEQGLNAPWTTINVTEPSVSKSVTIDVTDLVKRWHANKRNKGFFVKASAGSARFASRNNADATLHPKLTVKTSDGKIFTILCSADSSINVTTGEDMGTYGSVWCDSGGQAIAAYYPMGTISSPTITSAVLTWWLLNGGSTTATVNVFEMDGPEVTFYDGVATTGIAENYVLDKNLISHPAVIDAFDFQEKYVNTTSPDLKFFQGGTGQSKIREYSYNIGLQCNIVTLGQYKDGEIGLSNLEYAFFDANDKPKYNDLYVRYVIRYNSPWESTTSKVKMPGFSYRWGYRDSQVKDFSISTGNSGGRPSGLVSAHYEHFAPWVSGINATEDRIYTRNKVTLFNEKTTAHPLMLPPDGIRIMPLHYVPFWASAGLVEGQTYYCRNPRSEAGVAMSFQVSATPTGPILSLNSPSIDYNEWTPAVGFDDPAKWNIWRHGGSMRSQLGCPDPRPTNPFGRVMEMHTIVNYPGMGYSQGQAEPEFAWGYSGKFPAVVPDRWYSIEHHCRMNTISYPVRPDFFGGGIANADGLYEVWIDGQQAFKWQNVIFINHPDCSIQSFWFDIFHGGTKSGGSSPNATFTLSLARFVAATQYIGPLRKS